MKIVKIYSFKECPYCNELKARLTAMNIEYIDVDVMLPENKNDYNMVVEFTKCHDLPIISIDYQLLIPETSFRSIEQAAEVTRNLLSN